MTITEKVAYIKGLLEGLSLDETKPEVKVIKAIVDALDDIALTAADTEERVETLEGYCDELDDDLALLEDEVYDDVDGDYDDDEDDDGDVICVECPKCGEEVCLDDSMDFSKIKCPSCGEEFSCEISDEDKDI